LATVVQTWGSAPRRTGSQLAISGAGEIAGSVSGGCVEGAVVAEALDAMENARSVMLEYGVSDNDAFAVGLACGGTIRVLVEPVGAVMPVEILEELTAARKARRAVAYVTDGGDEKHLAYDGFEARFRRDRSGFEEDGKTFIAIHNPPLRMIIVGAVHIAQALVPMARIAGYDPIVIDPRESFASKARFPEAMILHDWPDEAVQSAGLDARTALVLLTHDPKLDDPALEQALNQEVFYIGALGSKRTHAARVQRLRDKGFAEDQIARIHGPIGLDLGAAGPAEIAVAIMAEVTQVLRLEEALVL
jgi:xanthine dehydrogenase accessory factor